MSKKSDITKPRGRGRPRTGIGPIIGLRLYPDITASLDDWIAEQPDKPSQPEAIRRLIELGIAASKRRKRGI